MSNTTEAPTEGKSELIATRRQDTYLAKSVADLERLVTHYPEEIRQETIWLQGFLLRHCRANMEQLRGIAAKIGHDISKSWVNNIINGYNFKPGEPGNWKPNGKAWSDFLALIDALRRYEQQALMKGKLPFCDTPTYECISDFIDGKRAAHAVCKFGGITGPTGSQKSACLKQYQIRHNHGQVIRVEAPSTGRLVQLQMKIADAYHVGVTRKLRDREGVIRDQLNETRTIIIDNAQRLYQPTKGSEQPAFNWLLEIQDDTECTIILSFTTDFVDVLTAGRAQGFFEQFIGRFGGDDALLHLPAYTPASDLRVIAKHVGIKPTREAMAWLRRWSERAGRCRVLFEKLQFARMFAQLDEREAITLDDLAEADAYRPQAVRSDSEGGDAQ